MPYRGNNYSFVIDSSFKPFTFQEMLAPYTIYKTESDKAEEAYIDLSDKADKFKYLSETLPEGSKARKIYEGYAEDLKAQADDFAQHGLTMSNRGALTGLRKRYSGEIGRLAEAQTKLDKEMDLRRQMSTKDSSILYALDNLSIDNYLDGATPNLYNISGNELYAKGAAAGKAASSRIYNNPEVQKLDKYYNNYFNTVGYSPEKMQEFRNNLAAIPELQKAAMDIARANNIGELGESSENYKTALQQIINGIADGAIYERRDNLQRNLGVLTAKEEEDKRQATLSYNLQVEGLNRQAAAQGLHWDKDTKSFKYDIRTDPRYAGELWKWKVEQDENGNWVVKEHSKAYEDAVKKGTIKADNSSKNGNKPVSKIDTSKLINNGKFERGGKASFGETKITSSCKRVTLDEIAQEDEAQANEIRSTLGSYGVPVEEMYDLWQDKDGNVYPRISNSIVLKNNSLNTDSTNTQSPVPGDNNFGGDWQNGY